VKRGAPLAKRSRCQLCGRSDPPGKATIDVRRMRTGDGTPFSACLDCRRARSGLGDEFQDKRKGDPK
jgi:hypothetical protein